MNKKIGELNISEKKVCKSYSFTNISNKDHLKFVHPKLMTENDNYDEDFKDDNKEEVKPPLNAELNTEGPLESNKKLNEENIINQEEPIDEEIAQLEQKLFQITTPKTVYM